MTQQRSPNYEPHGCACNTGAGQATIDVATGSSVEVTGCPTWRITLTVSYRTGEAMTLLLDSPEARRIAEALTAAADIADGPPVAVTTPGAVTR